MPLFTMGTYKLINKTDLCFHFSRSCFYSPIKGKKVLKELIVHSHFSKSIDIFSVQEWLLTVFDTFNARAEYLNCIKVPVNQSQTTGTSGQVSIMTSPSSNSDYPCYFQHNVLTSNVHRKLKN